MSRGIILLAMGDPMYGRLAFNAALSMKANDPNIHITLGYAESALADLFDYHRSYFDNFIEIPETFYTNYPPPVVTTKPVHTLDDFFAGAPTEAKLTPAPPCQKNYFKAKTHLYELSPYDQTIFLDVDSLWKLGKRVNPLLDSLGGVKYTPVCYQNPKGLPHQGSMQDWEMTKQIGFWASAEQYAAYYGKRTDGYFWETSTYFIYFEKCPETKAYFDKVQELMRDPSPDVPVKSYRGDMKPDEFYFNAASYLLQMGPCTYPYAPIAMYGQIENNWIKNHYGVTFPGTNGKDYYRMQVKNYQRNPSYYTRDPKLRRKPIEENAHNKKFWLMTK